MTPGILTTCASCAVPIPYTAPRCSKCHTRYCGPACQTQHWNTGGHNRALCKRIKRAGGAEKYHANQKYDEAVAEAVEASAEYVPEGATCYICTEAVVQRTGEGLVEGFCACGDRDGVDAGMMGVAHVSCLVRQAEVAMADEMSRSWASTQDNFRLWESCRLCGKRYHGDVKRAMGWACWRAHLSKPADNMVRRAAMDMLAGSLAQNGRYDEALDTYRASLDIVHHLNPSLLTDHPVVSFQLAQSCMALQTNIANTLMLLGRYDEGISRHRRVLQGKELMFREEGMPPGAFTPRVAQTCAEDRLLSILNLCTALIECEPTSGTMLREARSLLRANMADAQRVFGPNSNYHEYAFLWRGNYARTIYYDEGASEDDLREAGEVADAAYEAARRTFGEDHPLTLKLGRLGYDSEDSDSEPTVDGGAPPEPDADHDVARTMQDEINVDDAQGRPEFN
jgi:tetratricopeptide (TPR) repeat protein